MYCWHSLQTQARDDWWSFPRGLMLAQFTNTSTWWLVEFSQRPQGKSNAPTQNLYLAHLMLLSSCVTLTAHGFHGTKISLQHCNEDRVFTIRTTNLFIHSPEIFEHWKTYKILSVHHNKNLQIVSLYLFQQYYCSTCPCKN